MVRIYLDVCCLNRPFDDQTQSRVHLESEAVLIILSRINQVQYKWISSEAVTLEINQTPDRDRRNKLLLISAQAHAVMTVRKPEIIRARQLALLGFASYDSLHIACAESGTCDIFLTTDDAVLRRASGYSEKLLVKVINPLDWIREVERQ